MKETHGSFRGLLLVFVLATAPLAGCVYEPYPGYYAGVSNYDAAWNAALSGAQDAGVRITSPDRANGVIRGNSGKGDVVITVHRLADGAVRVQFDVKPADPGLVLIAGGGVAALEAALALRALAGDGLRVELLAPEPHFWYRPLAVAEPFGGERVHPVELADVAAACGAGLTLGAISAVDAVRRVARTTVGAEFEYDALLLATGFD